jgi:hypothetical protein
METLYTSLLTSDELVAASDQLLPVLQETLTGNPLLLAVAAEAESDVKAINLAATRELGNKLTDPIKSADGVRDNAFRTLRDFASVWAHNQTAPEANRTAGHRLSAMFTKHGNSLHRLGYNKQSGALEGLFADLASAQSQADLKQLNLDGFHAELIAAQDAFEAVWAQRSNPSTQDTLPLKWDHTVQLRWRLSFLLESVEQWERLGLPEATQPLVTRLNVIITDLMKPVLARQTREENQAAKEAAANS